MHQGILDPSYCCARDTFPDPAAGTTIRLMKLADCKALRNWWNELKIGDMLTRRSKVVESNLRGVKWWFEIDAIYCS
jgi:hypothetical protein